VEIGTILREKVDGIGMPIALLGSRIPVSRIPDFYSKAIKQTRTISIYAGIIR
jgi:multisubunit Na+/H+ antiporter MnhG subunit